MRVMVRLFLISSIYISRRKSQRGIQPVLYPVCWFTVSALMLWVSAMRNCISNRVRTSRCRADFFRLSKSRCGLPPRRAPDRLAALLTAFRLVYRVLPAPDFHRRERPQSTCTRPIFYFTDVSEPSHVIIGSVLTDWWDKKESNLRRAGLQPAALPTELSSHRATHFCLSALHRTA